MISGQRFREHGMRKLELAVVFARRLLSRKHMTGHTGHIVRLSSGVGGRSLVISGIPQASLLSTAVTRQAYPASGIFSD